MKTMKFLVISCLLFVGVCCQKSGHAVNADQNIIGGDEIKQENDFLEKIKQEPNLDVKWSMLVKHNAPHASDHRWAEYLVAKEVKFSILISELNARCYLTYYPEIFSKLRYSQSELDRLSRYLENAPRLFPGVVCPSRKTTGEVISIIVNKMVVTSGDYSICREERMASICKMWNKIEAAKDVNERFKMLIDYYPGLDVSKRLSKDEVIQGVVNELATSDAFGADMINKSPDLLSVIPFDREGLWRIGACFSYYNDGPSFFYTGDFSDLPKPSTLNDILSRVLGKPINSESDLQKHFKEAYP